MDVVYWTRCAQYHRHGRFNPFFNLVGVIVASNPAGRTLTRTQIRDAGVCAASLPNYLSIFIDDVRVRDGFLFSTRSPVIGASAANRNHIILSK